MPTAGASDVRIEIDTHLSDTEIEGDSTDDTSTGILGRVERDIEREMDSPPAAGTDDRRDLEAVLAAIHIATTRDRADSQTKSGRTSVTYEESLIDQLRSRARRLDAPDSLLGLDGGKPTASIHVPNTKGGH
jgi:hypothetical protein